MTDQCKNCTVRGDIKACLITECFQHENWYAVKQQERIDELESENQALKQYQMDRDFQLTQVCDILTDEMRAQNVENFSGWTFVDKVTGKEIELICQFVDGKTVGEINAELTGKNAKLQQELEESKRSEICATHAAQDMCVDMEQAKQERDELIKSNNNLKRPIELGDRVIFTKKGLQVNNIEQQVKGVEDFRGTTGFWEFSNCVFRTFTREYEKRLRTQASEMKESNCE